MNSSVEMLSRCVMSLQCDSTYVSLQAFTYIVTELADGGELSALLGATPERAARRLLVQLALAVRHMHARRVAHRDLKPEVSVHVHSNIYYFEALF